MIWKILEIYRRRTLARDLALRLAATMTIIIVLLGTAYFVVSVGQAQRNLSQEAIRLVEELADVLSIPAWNLDRASIEQIAMAYQQAESVAAVRVLDEAGRVMYESPTEEEGLIVETRPVVYEEQQIGQVEVMVSTQQVLALRRNITLLMLGIVVTIVSTVVLATGILLQRYLNVPLTNLTQGIENIAGGSYDQHLPPVKQADIDAIIEKVNEMARQIAERDRNLEQQVADRTRDLERRTLQLQAASEVSQAAASILSSEELTGQVVELIRERFGLYYVGLFRLDPSGRWGVLQAGTGEAGKAMLARGHRLEVGAGSMIGWSIANVQARVAQVAEEDAVRLATPELPETRSEAALPLRSRGQVLGALTVQSTKPGAFDKATLTVLQTLADQVALAIDNAQLFQQTQESLDAARQAYGELSQEAWIELLRGHPDLGFLRNELGTSPTSDLWRPEMESAMQTGQTTLGGDGETSLAIPIKVSDHVIGVLDAKRPVGAGAWSPDEIDLLEALSAQLSMALESARLYRDTQRRAVRERLVGEATARMRETLDMDAVLQTAVQEMRQALGLHDVTIRLEGPNGPEQPRYDKGGRP